MADASSKARRTARAKPPAPDEPAGRPGLADSRIGQRHLSLRDQVLAELRRRIVDAHYRPGERLTEERLAEDFGVSRNPVREALRVVEAEGFVEVQPRRGAVVATPAEDAMRDMFAVRALLEPLAARVAAERATDEDLAGLRTLLDQARAATEDGDLARVAELNTALHSRVFELSGNRWLVQFSVAMYRHVHWVFRLGAEARAGHSWEEHVRLVEALEAHDGDAAELAAVEHVQAAQTAAIDGASDAVAVAAAGGRTGRAARH
jgi:DNA-binding GntR family transcriptional regulator